MNSVIRLAIGLVAFMGLAFASAPGQAISVVGNLGWQPVPAICAEATNVNFNLAQRKLRFRCGPTSVQFTCTPAGPVSFSVPNQRVTVACATNTIAALSTTWSASPGGTVQVCTMDDFDFDAQERTVSFTCRNSPSQRRICYPAILPPAPNYTAGSVEFAYCPDAAFELVGHSGFEEGERWKPTFGQAP